MQSLAMTGIVCESAEHGPGRGVAIDCRAEFASKIRNLSFVLLGFRNSGVLCGVALSSHSLEAQDDLCRPRLMRFR